MTDDESFVIHEAETAILQADTEEAAEEAAREALRLAVKHGSDDERAEVVDLIVNQTRFNRSTVNDWEGDAIVDVAAEQVNVERIVEEVRDSREKPNNYTFYVTGERIDGEREFTLTTPELTRSQHAFCDRVFELTHFLPEFDEWADTLNHFMQSAAVETVHEAPIDIEHDVSREIVDKMASMDVVREMDEFKMDRGTKLLYDPATDSVAISSKTLREVADAVSTSDVNLRAVRDVLDGVLVDNDQRAGTSTTRSVRFYEGKHNAWQFKCEKLELLGHDLRPPEDDDDDDGGEGATVDESPDDGDAPADGPSVETTDETPEEGDVATDGGADGPPDDAPADDGPPPDDSLTGGPDTESPDAEDGPPGDGEADAE